MKKFLNQKLSSLMISLDCLRKEESCQDDWFLLLNLDLVNAENILFSDLFLKTSSVCYHCLLISLISGFVIFSVTVYYMPCKGMLIFFSFYIAFMIVSLSECARHSAFSFKVWNWSPPFIFIFMIFTFHFARLFLLNWFDLS